MNRVSRRLLPLAVLLLAGTTLGGCNTLTRLSQVGEEPPLTSIQNPTAIPAYQPVSMPMPAHTKEVAASAAASSPQRVPPPM